MDIHRRTGTPRLHQLGTPHIHFPHTGLELWTTHQHFHAFFQGGVWSGTWIGIYIPTIWRAGALWIGVAKSGSCDQSVWWTHRPAGGHETLARRWQQQGVLVGWRSTSAAACWASWTRKRSPALLHSDLEKGHRPLPRQRHQCPRCSLRRAEGMTGQERSSEPPSASRMPGEHFWSTRTLCFYSSGRSRGWPPHWSQGQIGGSSCRVQGIVVPRVGPSVVPSCWLTRQALGLDAHHRWKRCGLGRELPVAAACTWKAWASSWLLQADPRPHPTGLDFTPWCAPR